MAPSAVLNDEAVRINNGLPVNLKSSGTLSRPPLKYSGSLDAFESFDVTNVIGREFPTLKLSQIIGDDNKTRDLAILVSQRGVVFFRNQDLEINDQKRLGQKLGELTGKPETSKSRSITFERIPSDYAILKITQPSEDAGGDTLWASGYEAYDRLSPALQKLAEGLTATHYQPTFNEAAKKHGLELIAENRGAPENSGLDFTASHPVVRTNPVTGWKSLFAAGGQLKHGWIDDVTPRESDILKDYFLDTIAKNHDLQVRFRWTRNDVAIWDNRSVFHTTTNDYFGSRQGNRVVSLGEKPYFDPSSVSMRESLFKGGVPDGK